MVIDYYIQQWSALMSSVHLLSALMFLPYHSPLLCLLLYPTRHSSHLTHDPARYMVIDYYIQQWSALMSSVHLLSALMFLPYHIPLLCRLEERRVGMVH